MQDAINKLARAGLFALLAVFLFSGSTRADSGRGAGAVPPTAEEIRQHCRHGLVIFTLNAAFAIERGMGYEAIEARVFKEWLKKKATKALFDAQMEIVQAMIALDEEAMKTSLLKAEKECIDSNVEHYYGKKTL